MVGKYREDTNDQARRSILIPLEKSSSYAGYADFHQPVSCALVELFRVHVPLVVVFGLFIQWRASPREAPRRIAGGLAVDVPCGRECRA